MLPSKLILLLATFIVVSHGYNPMLQFQSKMRKCVACTVLISTVGATVPSISLADETSLDVKAPATTAKIRSFKAFVKKDLKLEEEVRLAEKEAEEDAKAAKIEKSRERFFEYEAKQADNYESRLEAAERKAATEVKRDKEEVRLLKAAEEKAEKEAAAARTEEEKAKRLAFAKELADKEKAAERKEKKAEEADRVYLAEEIQGKKIMAAKDAAALAEKKRFEVKEKVAEEAAAIAEEEEAKLKGRPKSNLWSVF